MKKGFTMLEMIIVVCILSILFLLTIPNIQNVINIVDDKGCKALVKVVDAAILEYKLQYDEYPTDILDLVNAGLLSEEQTQCSNNKTIIVSEGQAYVQ